jgi:hypothetical protein
MLPTGYSLLLTPLSGALKQSLQHLRRLISYLGALPRMGAPISIPNNVRRNGRMHHCGQQLRQDQGR